ncbi:MAG: phosphatidylserine decarboxylase [Terriglobales bacterium]
MIRDGIFYCTGFVAAAVVVAYLTAWGWAIPLLVLAIFALYFFRNPRRVVPAAPGIIVSPADGRVTHVDAPAADSPLGQEFAHRVSIFLSIFDVHVTRAPAAGRILSAQYRRGRFRSAMDPASASENEQNLVHLAGGPGAQPCLAFSQIAGLIARRIVFWPRPGDYVERGQLVGLIKFGSRVEVFLPAGSEITVAVGQRVQAGASLLARLPPSLAATTLPAADAHSRASA